MSAGIRIASWETNADGYISIHQHQLSHDPHVLLLLHEPGFAKRTIHADTLQAGDTVLITVRPQPVELDVIQIVDYKVPLVLKEKSERHRRPKEVPGSFPVYSVEQCLAYEALQCGLWQQNDTAAWRGILAWDTSNTNYKDKGSGLAQMIRQYFLHNISYPKQARDFCMEETVYACFEMNENGNVHYLRIMKGKHVDLALEVANALAQIPRINLRTAFPGDANSYRSRPLKPVRFLLPVRFILK